MQTTYVCPSQFLRSTKYSFILFDPSKFTGLKLKLKFKKKLKIVTK